LVINYQPGAVVLLERQVPRHGMIAANVFVGLFLSVAFLGRISNSTKQHSGQSHGDHHADSLHLDVLKSGGSLDGIWLGKSLTADYRGAHYYNFVLNPAEDLVSNQMITVQGGWERTLNLMFEDIFIKAGRPLGALVIDVGVNVGAFTLFASSMGCRVFGYEMQPFHANLVDMSLRLSGYRSRSHVKNKAVWYIGGKNFSFTPKKKNYGGTVLKEKESGGSLKIASIRIDEDLAHRAHQESDFFFMKMDIEGSEPYALLGMNAIIRNGRVRHIVIEVLGEAKLLKVLYAVGYTCRIFDEPPDCHWPHIASKCTFPTYQEAEKMLSSVQNSMTRGYIDFHCELNRTTSLSTSSSFVNPYKPSKEYPDDSVVRFKNDYFIILNGTNIKETAKESIKDIQAVPEISYDDIFAFDFVR
jgi:FkbM family methyltransferase